MKKYGHFSHRLNETVAVNFDFLACGRKRLFSDRMWRQISVNHPTTKKVPGAVVFSPAPGPAFRDVRANCFCASLLRTQFTLWCHATSCIERARCWRNVEIYSASGHLKSMHGFNSLKCPVTPYFLLIDHFLRWPTTVTAKSFSSRQIKRCCRDSCGPP